MKINKYIKAQKLAGKGYFKEFFPVTDKPSRTKHYDPDAPKFVYRSKVGNFTRKSNKVREGTNLFLNEANVPSFEKRDYAQYPKTKPMLGWERVYVGRGKWLQRGRRTKKYKNNLVNDMISRPTKSKFVPFAMTYKNNLSKKFNIIDQTGYSKIYDKTVERKVIRK